MSFSSFFPSFFLLILSYIFVHTNIYFILLVQDLHDCVVFFRKKKIAHTCAMIIGVYILIEIITRKYTKIN